MFEYMCPACKGYQYSASSERSHEPCIYCGHPGTILVVREVEDYGEEYESEFESDE